MANNYTLFSFAVGLETDEEKEWAQRAVTHLKEYDDSSEPDPETNELDAIIPPDGFFFYEAEVDADGLWLHSDEGGDPDHAVQFVQEFLRRFRPEDCVGFCWADTCSKSRLDEFGGGAVFITATGAEWMTTYEWLGKTTEAHSAKS